MPFADAVASSRGQEDRDDGDGDRDHDEPQPERAVPASARHRTLDLLALEPGFLAPLGFGRAASLRRPGCFLPRRYLSSSLGPASLPTARAFAPCRCAPYARSDLPRGIAGHLWSPASAMGEGHGHDRSRSGDQGRGPADQRARPLLQDHGARFHRADRDHRGVGHLADDGLHPVRQPGHPRFGQGQRGHDAAVPGGADRDGPRGGRHDARHGHLRELSRSRSRRGSG